MGQVSEQATAMLVRIIKVSLFLAFLFAMGWWSVQNDDDTPRLAPTETR